MMRSRLLTAAALAGVLVAGGVSSAAHAGPPGLRDAVDDIHDLGVTGVQGLTRTGDRTATARAGADVPQNGYFRMGSGTKTYVSVVLLQLAGERRLSLDDAVERLLPGVVSGNGNDGRRITVRQLLQHTSGIPDYIGDLEVIRSPEQYRAHRFDHWDAADLVALAMKRPPVFEPGTSWSYSNTDYILAGMIIKKVTGHSWSDEVRTRILAPLHLRQTYDPGDNPALRHPHAQAYHQFAPGGPLVDTTLWNTTAGDAAGALVTTPADLARFWQALQAGRLLEPAQMAEMHRTVPTRRTADGSVSQGYGLGIVWSSDSCGGHWSHDGDALGTGTVNAVSPDGKRVVVLALTTALADKTPARAVDQRAAQLIDDTLCG